MIWGGFRVAVSLPGWVFRTFDSLSTGFLIVDVLLVLVEDFIVGRVPSSSMAEISLVSHKASGMPLHIPYIPQRQDYETHTKETSDDDPNNHAQISDFRRTGPACPGFFDQGRRGYIHLGRPRGYDRENQRCSDSTVRESYDRRDQ